MIWLWALILGLPLLAALLLTADEPTRVFARRFAPWTSLPAVILAITWPVDLFVETRWFMVDGLFGLDEPARLFLLLTSVLWTIASFYARRYTADDPKRDRFQVFFLLTMMGNLGLVGAFDMISFYMFYAVMTFAAAGLVIHDQTTTAHFATRIYITMAVIGETVLLLGLVMAAQASPQWDLRAVGPDIAADPQATLITFLLLIGFGVKAGAVLLHMWLPLAHPAAPTPASAVLSGAMIKAGLLGWLRFLNGVELDTAALGGAVIALGLLAAFYGVLLGLVQTNPKANLAYSSISQMGAMTIAVGAGLIEPAVWPAAVTAASIYAVHHGMAKGSLFLSIGVAKSSVAKPAHRRLLLTGVAIGCLTLAGAPLTTGLLAKETLKHAAATLPQTWYRLTDAFLPIAAIGTTLLLARFVMLVHATMRPQTPRKPRKNTPQENPPDENTRANTCSTPAAGSEPAPLPTPSRPGLWTPWLVSVALVPVLPWAGLWWYDITPDVTGLWSPRTIWAGTWPLLIAAVVIALAIRQQWTANRSWKVMPGDVLGAFNRLVRLKVRLWTIAIVPTSVRLRRAAVESRNRGIRRLVRWMAAAEHLLTRWGTGGAMFVAMVLLLLIVLALAST